MPEKKAASAKQPPKPKNDELKLLKDEVAGLQEQLARAQADYLNLSRRSEQDKMEIGEFTKSNVAIRFLPILDNFERAIENLPADIAEHEWVKGVFGVQKNLERILIDMDIRPFVSIGEEVDTDKHEVVSQGPGETGKIITEYERGYMIGEKVLRHAKVVVGNGE